MNDGDFLRGDAYREIEIEGSESACSYLPGQKSTMTYRLAYELHQNRYESLLSRGWRRFGRTLFRPTCAVCRACQSLRVSIPNFQPSKSQRRIQRRNEHLTVTVRRPSISDEHISLYNRYHLDMHHRRRWPFREIHRDHYFESFLDGNFSFSREFQYRDNGRLVGLGLVDMTDRVMSSIYFFHDPEYRESGLGTHSVLCEVDAGKKAGCDWLYMGYYIRDCQSMNYKNRYEPNQVLEAYVSDVEEPTWVDAQWE